MHQTGTDQIYSVLSTHIKDSTSLYGSMNVGRLGEGLFLLCLYLAN
jgi:hypothetical protein